jgi:hypothetical protein
MAELDLLHKSLSAPTGAGRRLILTTRPATLQVRRS